MRGWKWRQILYDIKPVRTSRLFGAVMAGYFMNFVVPVGISPLVRAWVIARLEELRLPTILVTTAIERFVDGIVFGLIVALLFLIAAPPDSEKNLQLGLIVGGAGSLLLFSILFYLLFVFKAQINSPGPLFTRGLGWLDRVFRGRYAGLGDGFSEGVLWPGSHWRGFGVVAASVAMKIVSTTHFLWAGLAFGFLLAPSDYLFVMVFSGLAMIITRIVRIPGGGVVGSAFALKMLELPNEEVLMMVLVVHLSSVLMVTAIGAASLWKSGMTIGSLRDGATRFSEQKADEK